MVGASSRLFILFNGPLSLFHHRPPTLLRVTHRRFSRLSAVPHHLLPPSRANLPVRVKLSQRFHANATSNTLQQNNHIPADAYVVPPSHPWPEWSNLVEYISTAGYVNVNSSIKDEFVPNESLSMEFLDAASSCLGFARNRPDVLGWLPKKDIQVLVEDGAPFLFKSAIETGRKMRSFLQEEESNEATTVDLMKYIVSYASNPIIYPERSIKEATESSARNLLREMANFIARGPASHMPAFENFRGVGRDEQTPRNLGPNVNMKRGDWICPKCCFMNFAKNTKCLECEESRPQRQLTGGEWDCPQCNFFNYGRNTVCLKCECRRPGEAPLPKTPHQYRNNFGDNQTPNGDDFRKAKKNPETSFNHDLDQFQSNPSSDPGIYSKSTYGAQNGRKDGRSKSYAPFVPLPADMFAKKPEKTTIDDNEEKPMSNRSTKLQENSRNFDKSATRVENRIKDTTEEEKSDRWFKKVAELHDSADLTTAISDEDFPQLMPMRKGENRFVVSKKKDRSLTSPTYKRQQAMEQESNSNFVPFVPFPPDYFAKKDDKQQPKITTSTAKSTDETFSSENSSKDGLNMNLVQETQNQETSGTDSLKSRSRSFTSSSSTQVNRSGSTSETSNFETSWNKNSSKARFDMNLVQETQDQETSSTDSLNSRSRLFTSSSRTQVNIRSSAPETSNFDLKTPENPNPRSGWEGKSLEGSAVKEIDPLDMSEEAKAERWFRRVAQIKDISELSQIPDEDFPSIMPMRKGVNRFVVSKRKTPLERRLTSPQYRKNLRSMNDSGPTKKEGDSS